MVKKASTEIVYIWDTDVLVHPNQLIDSVNSLKGEYDISYPYDGKFIDVKDGQFTTLTENSVGGAFGVKKQKYIDAGMENENFEKWGHEDVERYARFLTLKLKIHRSNGSLFHLNHRKDSIKNSHALINMNEYRKVKSMDKMQLREYVKTFTNKINEIHLNMG